MGGVGGQGRSRGGSGAGARRGGSHGPRGGGHGQGARRDGRSAAGNQRRGQGRERGRGNQDGARHPGQPAGPERGSRRQTGREGRRRHTDPSRTFRSDPPRRVALEALTAVHRDDAYANLILPELIASAGLTGRDAAFATALTYGTLRLQGRYDAVLAQCVDRPLDRLDAAVLDVLRLGAHQLLGMRVPTHAAVSASVDLATDATSRGAAGLVNAVLRQVAAHDLAGWLTLVTGAAVVPEDAEDTDPAADPATDPAALAAVHAHPEWIVKVMRQALTRHGRPASELAALLEADNADPLVTLCARPGLVSPEHLAAEVRKRLGSTAQPADASPYGLVLTGGDPAALPAVRCARAGVEDAGSQLVALVLTEARLEGRDERWLDMCAGPGGKAALLGARAAQRGAHLVANEISPHRTGLVRSSVKALPVGRVEDGGVVEVRCGDGRRYADQRPGFFDRVLLDAPCSGLGSLRRRPESRWRRQPGDVTELTQTQRELLAAALRTVRVGGLVAYVTCSPHVEETELVVRDVRRWAERQGLGTELVPAGDVATRVAPVPPAGADRQLLQLWPHLDGTDAMFCALIRRTC